MSVSERSTPVPAKPEVSKSSASISRNISTSFSKARRFSKPQPTYGPSYIMLPSTREKRTCSFGYGKRWVPLNVSGRDSPDPGNYSPPSCFDRAVPCPRFVRAKSQTKYTHFHSPGPGSYDPVKPKSKNLQFSFRSKIQSQIKSFNPPPDQYSPCYSLIERSSYSGITFGKGDRVKISGRNQLSPGPGSYNLPSQFSKLSLSYIAPNRSKNSKRKKSTR